MPEPKDYKKEYKELYLPKTEPTIIDIPEMTFVALQGEGNPNEKDGEYQKALGVIYAIQYTIKMSKKGNMRIDTPGTFLSQELNKIPPHTEGVDSYVENEHLQS